MNIILLFTENKREVISMILLTTDNRKGSCWMEIRNGECESNVKRRMTMAECCNTVGKGWGSPCQECSTSRK